MFDLDEVGVVTPEQLHDLGRMIRTLSGRHPVWNEDQNARVLLELDPNGDGEVSCGEFARGFERRLPMLNSESEFTLVQFRAGFGLPRKMPNWCAGWIWMAMVWCSATTL